MPMTTDLLTPRRATRADIPACARIVAEWEASTGWLPGRLGADALAGYFEAAIDQREMWVIGDPVAAYASYNPENGQLVALYAADPGAGLGKVLMDHVRTGREALWLTTHAPNERAHRFYYREGFQKTAELPGDPPHEEVPLYRMDWRREPGSG